MTGTSILIGSRRELNKFLCPDMTFAKSRAGRKYTQVIDASLRIIVSDENKRRDIFRRCGERYAH
jgi:hypothetical protein